MPITILQNLKNLTKTFDLFQKNEYFINQNIEYKLKQVKTLYKISVLLRFYLKNKIQKTKLQQTCLNLDVNFTCSLF